MVSFDLYDARGNRYLVATPDQVRDEVRRFGVDLPDNAAEAAAEAAKPGDSWIARICELVCTTSPGADGLLIGPFTARGGLGLLIVNTATGELAERSGNGLTIFARYLVAKHKELIGAGRFLVTVHRYRAVEVAIERAVRDGEEGFWIDMGQPRFGYKAVDASAAYGDEHVRDGHRFSRVSVLEDIDDAWSSSVFVSVDNPHCVTFLDSETAVLSVEEREESLTDRLRRIANSHDHGGDEEPFPSGINLQWAYAEKQGRNESALIHARVFERAEGWTDSSGSSATAVASAARKLGFVVNKIVLVKMKHRDPLVISFEDPARVKYFGVAIKI